MGPDLEYEMSPRRVAHRSSRADVDGDAMGGDPPWTLSPEKFAPTKLSSVQKTPGYTMKNLPGSHPVGKSDSETMFVKWPGESSWSMWAAPNFMPILSASVSAASKDNQCQKGATEKAYRTRIPFVDGRQVKLVGSKREIIVVPDARRIHQFVVKFNGFNDRCRALLERQHRHFQCDL